jgi:5-methylcytosine-specific restriction endonuclease McrA
LSALALVVEKACSRCGETKPLEDFSRQKIGRYGRRADCKACQAAYNSAWKHANPDKIVAAREARYALRRDEILAYNKAWNRAHRPAMNQAVREWRTRNRKSVQEQKAAWRLANPDLVQKHKRAEYLRNRESYLARANAWRAANPERRREHSHKRRGRLMGAAGVEYTNAELIAARVEMYGGLCRYCGRDYESIDHRIPLARGGSHWPANLVPTCKSCNSRKNAKTESEFLILLAGEGVMQHHG